MNPSIRLGRLLGIPIGLHYSFFGILALLALLLWEQFGRVYPPWSLSERLGITLATTVLFFSSVVAHEMTHSLVAMSKGIPVKGITLFIFGGVSQIAREAPRPGTEVLIALVGPLSSIALGGVFWGIAWALAGVSEPLATMFWYLFLVNVVLGVFNLVPGFPMDGGRVVRGILWGVLRSYHRATRIAAILGRAVGCGFIILGVLLTFLGSLQGLWLALIGWFLENAAGAAHRQDQLQEGLRGYTARQLLNPFEPSIPRDLTLRQLVDGYSLQAGLPCVVTAGDDQIVGVVTPRSLRQVPQEAWALTLVSRVMTPWEDLEAVSSEEELDRVLEVMETERVDQVRVVEGGRGVGLITRERLLLFFRSRRDLGIS